MSIYSSFYYIIDLRRNWLKGRTKRKITNPSPSTPLIYWYTAQFGCWYLCRDSLCYSGDARSWYIISHRGMGLPSGRNRWTSTTCITSLVEPPQAHRESWFILCMDTAGRACAHARRHMLNAFPLGSFKHSRSVINRLKKQQCWHYGKHLYELWYIMKSAC